MTVQMPISKAMMVEMELLVGLMQSKNKTWSKKKTLMKMNKRARKQQSLAKKSKTRNRNRPRKSKRKKWQRMPSSKNS